jgi:hypothetical protein
VTLWHGTKHPYRAGDALVPGGIVACCPATPDDLPSPCGCDGRYMVWATPDLDDAVFAAKVRSCTCGDSVDHQPRVSEVELDEPESDLNSWGTASVMGPSGRVIKQVEGRGPTIEDVH